MEEKKYLRLGDIEAYRISFSLSNKVYELVSVWKNLDKDTVGKQFIRSVDSISANLAEGFGRFSKRDKIKFYRYSFGSVYESLDWNEKAHVRKILQQENYEYVFQELQKLPKAINSLIKYTNSHLTI